MPALDPGTSSMRRLTAALGLVILSEVLTLWIATLIPPGASLGIASASLICLLVITFLFSRLRSFAAKGIGAVASVALATLTMLLFGVSQMPFAVIGTTCLYFVALILGHKFSQDS